MEFPSRTAVVIESFANQSAGSVFDGVKMNVIYKTFPVRITDISVNESSDTGEDYLHLKNWNYSMNRPCVLRHRWQCG